MTMPLFFRFRDAIASLPALLILMILIVAGLQKAVKIVPHRDEPPVQIALMAPLPEPTPPVPTPPAPTPPKPAPTPPKPTPTPPQPVKQRVTEAQANPTPAPMAATPSPAVSATPSSHIAAEVAAAVPAPLVAAAPPPAPAKPSVNVSLEKAYEARLKAEVERQKVYPHSREATMEQPQGKVVVWLEVSRNGEVVGSGIETPASSMLLNRAAEGSLRRLKQVEKFPAEAFAGIDKKRFTVTFNYSTNPTEEQHDSQAN